MDTKTYCACFKCRKCGKEMRKQMCVIGFDVEKTNKDGNDHPIPFTLPGTTSYPFIELDPSFIHQCEDGIYGIMEMQYLEKLEKEKDDNEFNDELNSLK